MALVRRPLGLLIDLSGTIHIEDKVIQGSIEAVNLLRRNGVPFLFVTNTTKESQNKLWKRLDGIGFNIKSEEIFSSLTAAHDLVKSRNLRPFLLLSDSAMEDFSDINQDDPNAVVVGLAPEKFNHQYLTKAFCLIKEKKAPLIAIHKARYMQTPEGLSLGPGCFVTGLEYSADIKAEVVGKPQASFFSMALEKLNSKLSIKLDPKDVVMIGDDVRDDVNGGINYGLMGCLVRTGKYRSGDEALLTDGESFNFSNFAEAVNSWFENS